MKLQTSTHLSLKKFHRDSKSFESITYDGKSVVPKSSQARTIEWCHDDALLHPKKKASKNFSRKGLVEDDKKASRKCHHCQLTKRQKKKHGKLRAKQAEMTPWDALCTDLIGSRTIDHQGEGKKSFALHCSTMMDPATDRVV